MSEVNVSTTYRKVADLFFVKNLEVDIPGFIIHARLMHVDEKSTNSNYDVYVARNNGEGKSPTIIRDWTMRGAYQPRDGGEKMFRHRSNYGATIYTIGGVRELQAKNNLISAIFDALLGSCDTSDKAVIASYAEVAFAMFAHGVTTIPISDQYRASVVTPDNNLFGSRVWHVNMDGFVFNHTTWTLNIDSKIRLVARDDEVNTTYRDVDVMFISSAHQLIDANKVM